jgi:hypothetical protein
MNTRTYALFVLAFITLARTRQNISNKKQTTNRGDKMTQKTMTYTNWSTAVFPGFYESDLYNSDTIYNINEALDEGEPPVDFTDDGYTKFCESVARQAAESLADALELDQGEQKIIKASRFKKLWSPRFYNFDTDRIECELDIDWDALVEYVKDESYAFAAYLKDNFTSYDGFISFVPNITVLKLIFKRKDRDSICQLNTGFI